MKTGCAGQNKKKGRSISLPVIANSIAAQTDIRGSRTSWWRATSLVVLNLLMIAHFVQWRFSGRTISPIEPSETMYTLKNGAINAGFIFFIIAILATLVFGRFVCGWGCHILALQDLCAWVLKKFGLVPKPFRSRLLVFVPLIAALYMFVWPTAGRYLAGPGNQPTIPEFTNHLVTSDFWATFPSVAVAIPFLLICGFATVYFLGSKGFCTYACPYGGFFGIADKLSPGKIRVTDACNQCGHCTATCTSNVLVHAEVKQFGMVVDPGCMKCMDCVSVCPNDALYFGFGKPAIGVKKVIAKNYSLTWSEELLGAIVFLASFLGVWDVYQLVPMLMALGIAAITTFLALRALRFFRTGDLSFYRFHLKSSGRIQQAGWVFLTFAFLWLGLNLHSGWVRFHEMRGAKAFQNLQVPDELALAQPNPSQWLSQSDRQNVTSGRSHLRMAADFGLFANSEALAKLAWFEFLSGDPAQAADRLRNAADQQQGQPKALSLYYRGAILNRSGHYDQALTSLDQALRESPNLILANEERGESLWHLDRKEEAIAAWKNALRSNPRLPLSNYFLAGASSSAGSSQDAEAYENQAEASTPADPLFYWMLGLRLENVGMKDLAERNFARAIQLDPAFRARRNLDLLNKTNSAENKQGL